MKTKSLKSLAIIFFVSGIWDTVAAILYIFVIGTGRIIDNPPIDPFFSVFLGSFFLCFAYIQFLSAFNIRRYAFNVGCLIVGRSFYVFQLYTYMLFVADFPSTFWFTGIIDGLFTILYIIFALRGGLSLRDLFLPKISPIEQKPFIDLVNTILDKKEQNEDTIKEEKQIDIMVYKLYELTYDEVKFVDPAFDLTKVAYENFEVKG